MNDTKPAGWYYIGDGKLRYRDDYGWTDYYMDTSDPRAREWPPPAPRTLLQEPHEDETAWSSAPRARRANRMSGLFHRGRPAR